MGKKDFVEPIFLWDEVSAGLMRRDALTEVVGIKNDDELISHKTSDIIYARKTRISIKVCVHE